MTEADQNDRPQVSVVLPAYQAEGHVDRAIDSVCHQTFTDWELIVVDDGSTDGTRSAVEAAVSGRSIRYRYIWQLHAGSSAARNTGMKAATGRFIAFLDADDAMLPQRLARQMALFALRPNLGLVYGDFACTDLDGREHPSLFEAAAEQRQPAFSEVAPGLRLCGPDLVDVMTGRYVVSPITATIRREVFEAGCRFPEERCYSEEWVFFMRVARRFPAGYVNEPVAMHFHRAGSLSRTDPRRNTYEQCQVLSTIRALNPHASAVARRELDAQLAACLRQLGMDCFRSGAFRSAARAFYRAGVAAGTPRDFWRAARAWLHARSGAGGRASAPITPLGEGS